MNLSTRYQLTEGVAIRPERFGGLVYNYHSRQLYFLHSHELADFVGGLSGEEPLAAALETFRSRRSLSPEAGDGLLRSLAALEKLGLVVAVGD